MQGEAFRGASKAPRGMPSDMRGVRTRDDRPVQADQRFADHVPFLLPETWERRSTGCFGCRDPIANTTLGPDPLQELEFAFMGGCLRGLHERDRRSTAASIQDLPRRS